MFSMLAVVGRDSPSQTLLRYNFTWFLLCVSIFAVWPNLDLAVSHYFFNESSGLFIWEGLFAADLVYSLTHVFGVLVVLSLAALLALSVLLKTRILVRNRKTFVFLLSVCILGPILVVNVGFKGNWERPRPAQIAEYGGAQNYEAPFAPKFSCEECRSFVSGHASVGFMLFAFALLARSRRWLLLPVLAGGFIGVVRMGQGGHFLSDVIFSGWAVWFSTVFLHWLMLKNPTMWSAWTSKFWGAPVENHGSQSVARSTTKPSLHI